MLVLAHQGDDGEDRRLDIATRQGRAAAGGEDLANVHDVDLDTGAGPVVDGLDQAIDVACELTLASGSHGCSLLWSRWTPRPAGTPCGSSRIAQPAVSPTRRPASSLGPGPAPPACPAHTGCPGTRSPG